MIVSNGYRKYGFDAFGGKVLRKSDMSYWMKSPQRTSRAGVCLELGDEVMDVEEGFFELLPTICELWVKNPNCRIPLNDADRKLFIHNQVIVRGQFDTSAEAFAARHHLGFLHLDTIVATAGAYDGQGRNIITLCFRRDGSAYVNQDCRCPGISAGNVGGGEVNFDLPKGFWRTMSAEDIARKCWGSCHDDMLSRGVLAGLLKKAAQKGGFMIRP